MPGLYLLPEDELDFVRVFALDCRNYLVESIELLLGELVMRASEHCR